MNADWIEVAWCFLSLLVLIVAVGLVGESHSDVRLMRELGHAHGRRWLVAHGTYRREIVRLVIQLGFFFIGIVALITPPRHVEGYDASQFFGIVVFLGAQVGLLFNAILDYRMRWRLRLYDEMAVATQGDE